MAPLDRIDIIDRSAAHAHERSTMLVRMTQARTAAPDGITTVELHPGEVHDLPSALAQRYIELGAAEQIVTTPAPVEEASAPPTEEKAQEPPAEDRAADPQRETKPAPGKRQTRGSK